MRSAERAGKSAVFLCHNAPCSLSHAQRGGCDIDSAKKCGKAAFLYVSHSAVVIPCESARLASDAGNRERRERPPPPKKQGGHVTFRRGTV